MPQGYPEIMAADGAVLYLRTRIGDCAPLVETLRTWSMRSYRARHPEVIARIKLPIGVIVEGTKQRAWLRESLDTFADTIIAEVRRGLSEMETPGTSDG